MKRLLFIVLLSVSAFAAGNIPVDAWDNPDCTTFSWSWPFVIIAPCSQ